MRLKSLFIFRLVRVLQWVLPVFVLAFLVILVRDYRARRHQGTAQPALLQHLPRELTALTQGVTIERTDGSRRLYTIHAKSDEGYKDNKGILDDVDAIVYGDTPDKPPKRVKSERCAYDQATNNVQFLGNVQVQLDERTTGRTEELTYNHVTGLIASNTRSHIERPDSMTGEADRMEYNSQTGLLSLWGNVQVRGQNGVALDSDAAVFQDKDNWANATGNVVLRSKNGIVHAQSGRAELIPQTLQPRVVDLSGDVAAASAPDAAPDDSWKMHAPTMEVTIADGRAQKIYARNQVEAERGAGDSKRVLTGKEVDASMASSGKVDSIEARTGARLVGSNQTLVSDKIHISSTERIETEGPSTLQTQDRTIVGSHFIMQQGETATTFETANRSTMKSATSQSSSDRAAAKFDNRTNSLLALEQTGNFQFQNSDSGQKGHAQKATITENGDIVTLEGKPVVNTDEMQLEAGTIQLNQKNNSFSFVATQNVKTLTAGDEGQPALVTSKTAHGNSDTVYYDGDVQLWRQTAYIRSAHLKLVSLQSPNQDVHHELHAEGNVKSNLGMVIASAEKLDYDESSDIAHYTGNVHSRKQDMLMNSADMVVKMVDNEVSEIVSSGKVTTDLSSSHHGSGDHAVYEAKTDIVTLTGPNAQMTDPDRGLVRGSRITVMNVSDKKLDKMKVESDSSERALSQQKVKQ